MTTLFLRLCAALLAAVPVTARSDEMFTITTESQVLLGEEGGDTFGMESKTNGEVVILLVPGGENCTLRFPLRTGEAFPIRIRAGVGETLSCRISLDATGKGTSATFLSSCETASAANEPRCPGAN